MQGESKQMKKNKKTKEYVNQVYRIDQRINAKFEQLSSLNSLAEKATSTLSDMPGSCTRNVTRMEDIIVKIIALEDEINVDIDTLVDLQRKITDIIKRVSNPEYQILLELRYLCFENWEQVAGEMHYSVQHVYRLHDKALREIAMLLAAES